ncbi:MAG: hypothetical protein RDU76_06165 [Candidatus Edwardsbacteria bacterium]|nr:hypothetical protein [Candidatus Edwardsbacteria bacterium]
MATSRPADPRAVLIALADKLEARGQCQTLSIDPITYAEIRKIEINGGITIPVLGPARIIIVKEAQ